MASNSKQYATNGGTRCPHCNSDNLESGKLEADAGYANSEVSCLDCGSTWTDVYTLIGFSDLSTKKVINHAPV